MKPRLSLALVTLFSPSLCLADVMTQTVPFDYDAVNGVTFPVLQGFDTQGGARELLGVTFEFRHNFATEVFVESTGPTPVTADDFSISISYISLYQLGTIGGKTDPPFFGPGAMFIENASGDLGAYDGIPGNDGPDSYRRTFIEAFTVVQAYGLDEPAVLDAVTDVGPLTTVLGGFSEYFLGWINDPKWPTPGGGFPEYPNDAALWVSTPSLRHFGEIDITYEFVTVPGPGSACLIAMAAIVPLRRRRR